MSTGITESVVEQAALSWLEGLGYNIAHGPDISPEGARQERDSFGDVALVDRLRSALPIPPPNVFSLLSEHLQAIVDEQRANITSRERSLRCVTLFCPSSCRGRFGCPPKLCAHGQHADGGEAAEGPSQQCASGNPQSPALSGQVARSHQVGEVYNVYCDESCHLENDHQPVMVLGAVWCPLSKTRAIARRIRDIKMSHGMPHGFEVKWKKVSHGKESLYVELLNYFFDEDHLHFRALIVPDKSKLNHSDFQQDHDTWYYKMYFDMLKLILSPEDRYRIYLDMKDTRSAEKVRILHEVLCNTMYDFRHEIIERVQTVRSEEIEQVQLADLLIGAVSYANRKLRGNRAKEVLVERMKRLSGYCLTRTTLVREMKVNLFRWRAKETQQ